MSILPHVPGRDADRRPEAAGRGVSESELAMAQRTELHLDLTDVQLTELLPTPEPLNLVEVVPVASYVVHPPYPGATDHVMTLGVFEILPGGVR
jgi:hypothetical protein